MSLSVVKWLRRAVICL